MTTNQNWTIDDLTLAKQCPADWDKMIGTDRVRICGECRLNVYNFSQLTRAEAQAIAEENEGAFCGRFYRRADGTVLTKDCPLQQRLWLAGMRAASRGLAWVAALATTLIGLVLGGSCLKEQLNVAISSAFSKVIKDLDRTNIGSMAAPTSYNPPK